MNQEVKRGLEHVDNVSKVVIRDEVVVSGPASDQESNELICKGSGVSESFDGYRYSKSKLEGCSLANGVTNLLVSATSLVRACQLYA